MKDRLTFYHPAEERFNFISHGIGLILSVMALILLVAYAVSGGSLRHVFSFSIYGASLVILYTASTLYHYVQEPALRYKLNIFDHAAIYVLIAGSYTPFVLHVLQGTIGWTMFLLVWALAFAGVFLKLFFTGKYGLLSTAGYLLMGWMAIFALDPLIENFPATGVFWVLTGGVAYTVGAVLHGLKKIRFNHAIFHVFVLLGSICHFMAVFLYIVPNP